MRVAVFSTKSYDRKFLEAANRGRPHELVFFEPRLSIETASLAAGYEAVCAFVNDELGADVLATLTEGGTRLVALRSAGFNHCDLEAADRLGLSVVRVPAYSPHAVAEHTVGMMLALGRRLHKAYARVREGNFSLEGLLGIDLHRCQVGIVGTGRIGAVVAQILAGFGCGLHFYDVAHDPQCEKLGRYRSLDELWSVSDIVTLHCPLLAATRYLVNSESLARMKPGVMLINTSRGALIDTSAVIEALKSGRIGHLGIDVYEEEEKLFFEDKSTEVIQDDVFSRLLTFPNVLVTGHQAFFTVEALTNIAGTTVASLDEFAAGKSLSCRIQAPAGRG